MPEKYSTWLTQWNVLQNHDYLWTYQVWSGSIHPWFWIKEIFCLDSFSYCSFPEIHSFHKSTWQNRHIHKNYRHTYEISGLQSPFVEENLGLWSCRTWIVCFSQNISIRSGQIFFFIGAEEIIWWWRMTVELLWLWEEKVSSDKVKEAGFCPVGPN